MKKFLSIASASAALAIAMASMGCMSARTTNTARTAVEEALMSQSAEAAITQFDFAAIKGKKFFINTSGMKPDDKDYMTGLLRHHLLEAGGVDTDQKHADIIVCPEVAHFATDQRTLLLGIPAIPIVMPTGTLTTPEAALFKKDTQQGLSRLFVFTEDAATSKLLSTTPKVISQRYYTRWTILFFINFRTTDLVDPH